jgi:hypothetical protein
MHNRRSDFSMGTLQKQQLTLKVHCFWRFLARKKEREKTLFLYTLISWRVGRGAVDVSELAVVPRVT